MPARTQFSITTCNLYNLNEPNLRIYTDTDGWSQEEYDRKINWMTSLLKTVESDVWGFQEVWHKESVKKIFQNSGIATDYELLIPDDHQGQRIICGAAVKKSILVGEPEWISDFPEELKIVSAGGDPQTSEISVQIDKFSRPVLHLRVKPRSNGKIIHIFVCHFKSKGPTRIDKEDWYTRADHGDHRTAIGSAISTVRRTAEAAALRVILTKLMKGNDTPTMVIGDLNDGQDSNTLNILTEQPTYLLSGLQKGGADNGLYGTSDLQKYRSLRDIYYTHVYKNKREILDHILVSQEFYDNSKKRLWAFKGMEVINDHLNSHDHKADGSVDHGVVRSCFEYRPV